MIGSPVREILRRAGGISRGVVERDMSTRSGNSTKKAHAKPQRKPSGLPSASFCSHTDSNESQSGLLHGLFCVFAPLRELFASSEPEARGHTQCSTPCRRASLPSATHLLDLPEREQADHQAGDEAHAGDAPPLLARHP